MRSSNKPLIYTSAALVSFAGNSILSRLALAGATIDAATFSSVRIIAGAAMLLVVARSVQGGSFRLKGSWTSGTTLFLYAIPFSFAYVSLTIGTGALILFGSVQVTMMTAAVMLRERPSPAQWLGLALALAGLVYLVLPGLAAPSLIGSVYMVLSGVAWGIYSLAGRGAVDPLGQTTGNFVRAVPLAIVVSVLRSSDIHVEPRGLMLAAVSGAITSGLGYVFWYSAVRGLTATRAAGLQILVPVLAAVGGVVFMGEAMSLRLVVSAALVLGGVGLAAWRG